MNYYVCFEIGYIQNEFAKYVGELQTQLDLHNEIHT